MQKQIFFIIKLYSQSSAESNNVNIHIIVQNSLCTKIGNKKLHLKPRDNEQLI
ncbi:hypothetical protein GCM10009193_14160 [Shewanella aestuarii]|nr:hypothetical protein GCM10009193_14160 [Shewanella aestuarii]